MTAKTNPQPASKRTRGVQVTTIVRRGLAGTVLVAALGVMPGAARASVIRTVCASGCDFTSVSQAIGASTGGDRIELMPGTYPEQVNVTKPLSIFGPPGGPRPVIEFTGAGATVTIAAAGAGTTVTDLDIRGLGAATSALVADGAVTAMDLDLIATATCADLAGAAPSQLGPRVTATTSSVIDPCLAAGLFAADRVIGVTVNAPRTAGVQLNDGATLTDSTVKAAAALTIEGGTVRRSTLNGTSAGVIAATGTRATAALVSDSVVTSTANGGVAVQAAVINMIPIPVKVRNVTAIATGNGSTGLEARSQDPQGAPVPAGAAIDARNVIARGTARDVWAEPGAGSGCSGACAPGQVAIGYSNFRTADGVIDTTIGHNQSADPQLVNPTVGAGQDFHIASASSPVIGAGIADPNNGATDRDGVAHPDPPAIGAYEYPVSPAAQPGTPPPGPAVPTGKTGTSARPTISRLAETNSVFAVARASTPLQGRTAAASRKRGTTFSFVLDQPAAVTIVITMRATCARTKAGRRRNPRCARTVARLTRSAHAGLNRLPFSGRIRGRPLKPGDYRAMFAASAAASSDPKTLHFRIVAR